VCIPRGTVCGSTSTSTSFDTITLSLIFIPAALETDGRYSRLIMAVAVLLHRRRQLTTHILLYARTL
jgi:hypothetical protein